ncbi:unnamed protein product [Orchesella dallaii]
MLSKLSTATRILGRVNVSPSTLARRRPWILPYLSSISSNSSKLENQSAPLSTKDDGLEETREKSREAQIKEPPSDLKKYKTSFGKDIFLGKFDLDLFEFPEVLEKERHETLHEMLVPIERFFSEEVDSKQIDLDAKIPDKVLQGLKELGLYGQQVPTEYGGLGLNATEYARLQEIISLDGSVAVTLAAHQTIGYKGLLLYGTEEQKQKYLPKLASGEMVAAFALTEPSSGSDAASIQTRAKLSQDGKHWIMNGGKIWISNGGTADFFTVFANTSDENAPVKSSRSISAFMVERKFGGVTNGKPEDKHGIRGSNTAEVHFDNVKIPAENILGEEGDGFKIAMNILNSGRFSMGSAGAGGLKKLMSIAAEHAISRKQFGKYLSEFGLIKDKFVKMAADIYVMEAMAYTTAGLIDGGKYEDCAQEAAMVKVYSSEATYRCTNECLQILGGMGYMRDYPIERALRDSRIMSIFEGTNEILRLLVALNGCKHAGQGLRDMVKQLRNPFQFPNLVWKKAFERRRHANDNPKLDLKLSRFLHPSLEAASESLEYSVLRLQFGTEMLLQAHGKNILDEQLMLQRIADIAIDIYAMTCALSRASRAYCIGLPNAQHEVHLAEYFCIGALHRVKHNMECILGGPGTNGDELSKAIADQIFKHKGYFPEHPLNKTFW